MISYSDSIFLMQLFTASVMSVAYMAYACSSMILSKRFKMEEPRMTPPLMYRSKRNDFQSYISAFRAWLFGVATPFTWLI